MIQCITTGVVDILNWSQIFTASGSPVINFMPTETPKINLISLWESELIWSQKSLATIFIFYLFLQFSLQMMSQLHHLYIYKLRYSHFQRRQCTFGEHCRYSLNLPTQSKPTRTFRGSVPPPPGLIVLMRGFKKDPFYTFL